MTGLHLGNAPVASSRGGQRPLRVALRNGQTQAMASRCYRRYASIGCKARAAADRSARPRALFLIQSHPTYKIYSCNDANDARLVDVPRVRASAARRRLDRLPLGPHRNRRKRPRRRHRPHPRQRGRTPHTQPQHRGDNAVRIISAFTDRTESLISGTPEKQRQAQRERQAAEVAHAIISTKEELRPDGS